MNKVILKKLPKSEVELKVKIPEGKIAGFFDRAARDYSKKHPLRGFRPGKAPRQVVEREIGKERLMKEAAELAVKESYVEALVDKKIEALGAPKIKLKKTKQGEPWEYTARVAVFPKLKLKDVRKLGIKKPELKKIKVTAAEVEKTIKQLRTMRASLITVNRPAKAGDRVEVDFKLFMGKAPYEGGSSVNHPIVIGEKKFIPGFEEQLIGMKKDEKKRFSLVFPKEYHDKKLQEKKGEFRVTMKLVQEQELPKLDANFVKAAGNFKSVADFKKKIANNLKMEKEMRAVNVGLEKAFEKIVKSAQGELPKIMVEDEKEKMYAELEEKVRTMGITMHDYLGQLKKTREDLLKSWDESAQKRIKVSLAIQEIAEKEGIKASAAEVKEKAEGLITRLGEKADPKKIDAGRVENYARGLIINDKVVEWLKKEILGVK